MKIWKIWQNWKFSCIDSPWYEILEGSSGHIFPTSCLWKRNHPWRRQFDQEKFLIPCLPRFVGTQESMSEYCDEYLIVFYIIIVWFTRVVILCPCIWFTCKYDQQVCHGGMWRLPIGHRWHWVHPSWGFQMKDDLDVHYSFFTKRDHIKLRRVY